MPKHLLIVDDDEDTLVLMEMVLKKHFDKIILASNGDKALKLLKKDDTIRYIISDIEMPILNGNNLCSAAKQISPSIKVFALTAYNSKHHIEVMKQSGFDEIFVKPYQTNYLDIILKYTL